MYNKYMSMNKFDLIAKIKALETHIQKNQDNFKELEQSNQLENLKNTELEQINKDLNEKIEEINEEMKKLKKEEELQNYQKHYLEENFYDIVIDINSITSVSTKGWNLKFNPSILAKLKKEIKLKKEKKEKEKEKKEIKEKLEDSEEQEEQNTITLGVLGNNNKGKSFLLSKISKIKLLTGTSIETKGLSIKYPDLKGFKGRRLVLLDSAGLETPVLKKFGKQEDKKEEKEKPEQKEDNQKSNDENNNQEETIIKNNTNKNESKKKSNEEEEFVRNKMFKENARDKNMTELFLENFIIRFSDILLVVVGKLTYSEQLLINKIKVESKTHNKGRIFIIHNLQEFREVKQVEDYIKSTLLKCSTFNLKKKTWISSQKDPENEIKIQNEIKLENEENKKDENEIKNEIEENENHDAINEKENPNEINEIKEENIENKINEKENMNEIYEIEIKNEIQENKNIPEIQKKKTKIKMKLLT